ncbi:MAG: hypothetical protein LBT04_04610 [Prevotellaceae bacterium]|jgi:peptidase E|nr:hypothetical protein [Prevotellaceae bacterium]
MQNSRNRKETIAINQGEKEMIVVSGGERFVYLQKCEGNIDNPQSANMVEVRNNK